MDAEDASALKRVWPFASYNNDRPEYGWCSNGCDFVVRLTNEIGAVRHYVIRHSFRHWMWPVRKMDEDWVKSDIKSFKIFSIGVPNDGVSAKRVDILHVPHAWLGLHARNPQVITSWVKGVGEVLPKETYASTDAFVERSVEVTITRPAGVATCAVVPTLDAVWASEKAVFDTLAAENLLPTGTRVRVSCVCPGRKCFDGCERGFMYDVPKPEPVAPEAVAAEEDEAAEDAELDNETQMEIKEETHMDAVRRRRRLLTTEESERDGADAAEDEVDHDADYTHEEDDESGGKSSSGESGARARRHEFLDDEDEDNEHEAEAVAVATDVDDASDEDTAAELGGAVKYWITVYYKCAHWPRTSRFFNNAKNVRRCQMETEEDGAAQIAKKCKNAKFNDKYAYQCANGLQGPPVDESPPATATPAAPAASPKSVPPQCGCPMYKEFDVEARTCQKGTVPASALTKQYVAPGVYYLKDADGTPHNVAATGTRSLEIYGKDVRVGPDSTVAEVVAACRAQVDCAGFFAGAFNPENPGRNRPRFFSNKCRSPCYAKVNQDKPDAQIFYQFDDYPNPWEKYVAGEDTSDDASAATVTLRFAIRGPADAVAAAAAAFPAARAKRQAFANGFGGFFPAEAQASVSEDAFAVAVVEAPAAAAAAEPSALGAASASGATSGAARASAPETLSSRFRVGTAAAAAVGVAAVVAAVVRATKASESSEDTDRFALDREGGACGATLSYGAV